MINDSLGDRLKIYERRDSGAYLCPMLPAICRLDGKAFHTFTRGMDRPFDMRLIALMQDVTKFLVEESCASMGFTQSDEITLTWHSPTFESQIFFNGRVSKMTSVLASLATAKFNQLLPEKLGKEYADKLPVFDARVFNVPTRSEGANVFIWREKDAVRNSVQMVAQSLYSHNELQNRNSAELQEMIFRKGQNWNDYPTMVRRGSYFQRYTTYRPFAPHELDKLPPQHEARHNPDLKIQRTEVRWVNMPILTTVVNREAVIYAGADPITVED